MKEKNMTLFRRNIPSHSCGNKVGKYRQVGKIQKEKNYFALLKTT